MLLATWGPALHLRVESHLGHSVQVAYGKRAS